MKGIHFTRILLVLISTSIVSFSGGLQIGKEKNLNNSLSPSEIITKRISNEIKMCETKWQSKCGLAMTKSSDGIIYYDVEPNDMIKKSIKLYKDE